MNKKKYLYKESDLFVWQEGNKRHLSFDDEIIQSTIDCKAPYLLINDYAKAMVVALELLKRPKHFLLLGLGGGTLLHYLLHNQKAKSITVIEKSARVIAVAEHYFFCDKLPSLVHIIHQDVNDYVKNTNNAFDVIFLDIFTAEANNFNLTLPLIEKLLPMLSKQSILSINVACFSKEEVKKVFLTMQSYFNNSFFSIPLKDKQNLICSGSKAIDNVKERITPHLCKHRLKMQIEHTEYGLILNQQE